MLLTWQVDTAVALLTAATRTAPPLMAPLAWFSLASAHAKTGAHDMCALCFHRAAAAASSALSRLPPAQQDSVQAQELRKILSAASDNAVLSGSKVLPRDWLSALNDERLQGVWGAALDAAAHVFKARAGGAAAGDAAAGARAAGVVLVAGGLGVEAARLTQHLQSLHVSGSKGDRGSNGFGAKAGVPLSVVSCHGDALSCALATQLAAANGLLRLEGERKGQQVQLQVAPSIREWATEQLPARQAHGKVKGPKGSERTRDVNGPGISTVHGPLAAGLVVPDACGAGLGVLPALAHALAQAAPFLGPRPLLMPCAISIKGALVESADLVAMNQVDVEGMRAETGLEYGPANELLWRHFRSMQVRAGVLYVARCHDFCLRTGVSCKICPPCQYHTSTCSSPMGANH